MPGDGDIWRQEHLERGRLGDRDTFLILPPPSFLLHPNGTRALNNLHPQCSDASPRSIPGASPLSHPSPWAQTLCKHHISLWVY